MNSSNYRFTLDMQNDQSQVSLPVRLGDTNRRLCISLTDGGRPFVIEDGFLALFVGRKADGKELNNYCPIENNSVILYDFTEQTANVTGIVECEIRVFNTEGEPITSPRFVMIVDSRVSSETVAISEDERNIIDQIAQNEVAREQAETDRADAENARVIYESSRITNEDARQLAEIARDNAETDRTNAEAQREQNELTRKINEAGRNDAEGMRYDNESTRQYNESQRVSAEANRVTDEASRVEAEAIREANAQLYGNAFRGSASGEVVRVDDVSPVVQNVKCRVYRKNHWNMSAVDSTNLITANGDGTVTIKESNYACTSNNTLREICPTLREGDTVTLSISTTGRKLVYLSEAGVRIDTGTTITLTEEMLNSKVVFYGAYMQDADYAEPHTISWIQLEKGTGVTEYEPYEEVTGINVKQFGKQLLTPQGRTVTNFGAYSNGTQRSLAENCIYKGLSVNNYYSPNYVTSSYLSDTRTMSVKLSNNSGYGIGFSYKVKPNETYTLSVSDRPSASSRLAFSYYSKEGVHLSYAITTMGSSENFITATVPEDAYWMVVLLIVTVADTDVIFRNIQVEMGDTATKYETFKEPSVYTVTSDGTVEGIKSIAPTMTLLTDTENVVIEAEYSQDVNILKGRLQECLNAIVEIQKTLIGGIAQ